MRKPTVHLNGTDPQSLFDAYRNAYRAVQKAREATAECAPNGRNFYPQDDAATGEATAEHNARLTALFTVEQELAELAMHVFDTSNDKVRW